MPCLIYPLKFGIGHFTILFQLFMEIATVKAQYTTRTGLQHTTHTKHNTHNTQHTQHTHTHPPLAWQDDIKSLQKKGTE